MSNQQTTKSKHFLDSVVENTFEEENNITDNNVVNEEDQEDDENQDEFDQLTEEEKLALEEERKRLENEDEDQNESNEDSVDNVQNQNNDDFTFSPFIQELVDSDVLVMPEGKDYDDTTEGFKELIEDNAKLKFEDYKNNTLKNPVSIKFIEFLEAGGTPDEFIERASEIPDYANMKLDDEATVKNMIADHLFIQGYEEEDIKTQLEEYEELGSLTKQGTIAQKYLIRYAEKELANITKQQQEAEEQKQTALQLELEELKKDIYEKPEIGGFKLTKTERDNLLNYITKPVKREGNKVYTQNTLDDSKETKLAIALYKMKKFSFKDIENKIETKKVGELQNQLKKKPDKLSGKNNTNQEENVSTKIQGFDWLMTK